MVVVIVTIIADELDFHGNTGYYSYSPFEIPDLNSIWSCTFEL